MNEQIRLINESIEKLKEKKVEELIMLHNEIREKSKKIMELLFDNFNISNKLEKEIAKEMLPQILDEIDFTLEEKEREINEKYDKEINELSVKLKVLSRLKEDIDEFLKK